ncbi:MAG: protease modulator HflC [Lachnospiraceae bacterium]|nr:protease modulator HflC [Lachnospiraceae bacterium]
MKKVIRNILIGVAAFFAIIVLFGSMYTTSENEYTVVKQFGRIVATNDSAGLRFKVPMIQSVSTVPKAKQIYDLSASESITSDKKTMIVDAYVIWKVTDAKKFTSTLNASTTTAQGRIDVIVYNALKTTISSMTQEELIASRDSYVKIEATKAELEDVDIQDMEASKTDEKGNTIEDKKKDVDVIVISEKLLQCIGSQCDQYGMEITDVKIKVLDLPDENKEAVYNRMVTERNNIAAAYKAQGESEAQMIKNTTDAEVAVTIANAEADAKATEAEGEAEYMRILSKVYNNKDKADFYSFSLQLDALKESVTKGNTTIVLDSDSPIAKIFENSY